MITKQKTMFYFVGDEAFSSLAEAQKCDLKKLMPVNPELSELRAVPDEEFTGKLSEWLLKNSVAIVDILTTTPRSRAKARKANGAKKTRKPKSGTSPVEAPAAPAA